MISKYLKNVYQSKMISLNSLKLLSAEWKVIDNSSIERKFSFQTFEDAVEFMNKINYYLYQKKIKAKVSNVYNGVGVKIEETHLKELTEREADAAFTISAIYSTPDYKILDKDYYELHFSIKDRMDFNLSNKKIETCKKY
jgi:pterin-4a-carbinolamine dehydratase